MDSDLADESGVSTLALEAEEILAIAAQAGPAGEDTAILINRQGGMRMLNAAGWSLSGLLAEFGAAAVYKVERRRSAIRVEAGNGAERLIVERPQPPKMSDFGFVIH